jgi:hypothetical protein
MCGSLNLLGFVALLTFGCSGGVEGNVRTDDKVGKPYPVEATDDESSNFAGYSADEIAVFCGEPGCTNWTDPVGIAYHFQGRVTCPYGQTETDIATLPATDKGRCRVPAADSVMTDEPVTVAVQPQLVDRPPSKTVYYSCACSGTDSTREYCSCPADMHCEQQGFALKTVTGFCVRDDSLYDRVTVSRVECSRFDTDPKTDCGNDRQNP